MTTIHDEIAEKVELAKTYAEDGAFGSAARIYREIADRYEQRADWLTSQLSAEMDRDQRPNQDDQECHKNCDDPDCPYTH